MTIGRGACDIIIGQSTFNYLTHKNVKFYSQFVTIKFFFFIISDLISIKVNQFHLYLKNIFDAYARML